MGDENCGEGRNIQEVEPQVRHVAYSVTEVRAVCRDLGNPRARVNACFIRIRSITHTGTRPLVVRASTRQSRGGTFCNYTFSYSPQ